MVTTQDLNDFREGIKEDLRDFKSDIKDEIKEFKLDIEKKFKKFEEDQEKKFNLSKQAIKIEAWVIAILLLFVLGGTVTNLAKNITNQNELSYTKKNIAVVVNTVEFVALKQQRAEFLQSKDTVKVKEIDIKIAQCNAQLTELKKSILPIMFTARGIKNE